jgi:condensin complex subunit 3
LVVTLRKIQEACCYEAPAAKKKQQAEDFSQTEFNDEVERCVLRVLPVKKSEAVGEKVIRFLGVFLAHAVEKGRILLWYRVCDGIWANALQTTPYSAKLRGMMLETRPRASSELSYSTRFWAT